MIKPPNIERIKTQFTLNWVTPTNDKYKKIKSKCYAS
jgi:hypothetical protein